MARLSGQHPEKVGSNPTVGPTFTIGDCMSDIGDDFRAMRDHRRARKQHYHQTQLPQDKKRVIGLAAHIDERNDGEHWIVTAGNARIVDYWPSTGRWIVRRGNNKTGYRVDGLICFLEKNKGK